MAPFYQYNFVSPEPLFAQVREELRSFFDGGAMDDVLFPTWLNQALRKLSRGTYPIAPAVLSIQDFKARLPEDFIAVRELWVCTQGVVEADAPTAAYFVAEASPLELPDHGCTVEHCTEVPERIRVVMKETRKLVAEYYRQHLLRPGSVNARQACAPGCRNLSASALDTFEIADRSIVTNFRTGTLDLLYYSNQVDSCENPLVPDNEKIRAYLDAYLKARCWEILANNTTDEGTYRRYDQKAAEYNQKADVAWISADIEMKKETPEKKAQRLKREASRLNRYNIP